MAYFMLFYKYTMQFFLIIKVGFYTSQLHYVVQCNYIFWLIKQRIYLLSKEHCYKYCLLDTRNKCLVAKYQTHILQKQNLDIHLYSLTLHWYSRSLLLVHLPCHLLHKRHDMDWWSILGWAASCNPKSK